jgi:membrane protease YdiL (CAAX protease family)
MYLSLGRFMKGLYGAGVGFIFSQILFGLLNLNNVKGIGMDRFVWFYNHSRNDYIMIITISAIFFFVFYIWGDRILDSMSPHYKGTPFNKEKDDEREH